MAEEQLREKTALVTGAGHRIGRALALALAGRGVHVAVHYNHSQQESLALCELLKEKNVRSWTIEADFESSEETEGLISRVVSQTGTLDFLINNASIFPSSRLKAVSRTDLHKHLAINSWAPLVLSRNFARLAGKGKILNILDTRVSAFDPSHFSYTLSKRMLSTITRWTAWEFAPHISVNAVAPGLILPPPGKKEADLEKMASSIPLQRRGEPSDVIEAALFLLKSTFITGQTIFVDGGSHLRGEAAWTES